MKTLPHDEGKGKNVVTEELVAATLLHISTPTSKSKEPQYIFKKRSPDTTKPVDEHPDVTEDQSQSHEPDLVFSDTESDKDGPKDELTILDTTNVEKESESHDREHTVEPHTTLDDEFIATSYPEVQENLKLKADDQKVLLEPEF